MFNDRTPAYQEISDTLYDIFNSHRIRSYDQVPALAEMPELLSKLAGITELGIDTEKASDIMKLAIANHDDGYVVNPATLASSFYGAWYNYPQPCTVVLPS